MEGKANTRREDGKRAIDPWGFWKAPLHTEVPAGRGGGTAGEGVGGGSKWEGESRMTSKFWTEGWGCLPGRRSRGGGVHLEVGGRQWVKDASGKSQGEVSRQLGPLVWESEKRSGLELEIWVHWRKGFKQSHPGKGKIVKDRTLGFRKKEWPEMWGEGQEKTESWCWFTEGLCAESCVVMLHWCLLLLERKSPDAGVERKPK